MTKPNLIVFRLPDDEEGKLFLQAGINEDGSLDDNARVFSVHPGDSYEQLQFSELILAEAYEGGSYELARIPIINGETGEHAVLHKIMHDMQHIVDCMIEAYNKAPTLQ